MAERAAIAFHIANGLALGLFLFSAGVQLNDPDPVAWIAVYGAAAVVSGAAWFEMPWWVPAVLAAVAMAWIGVLVWGGLPAEQHPMPMGPQSGWLAGEVVREGLGLGLVSVWMTVLLVRSTEAWRDGPGARHLDRDDA